MFELSDQKKELLATDGNLLVLGGPGSGKTTIALLKANHEVINKSLHKGQRILFLSFARVTVARVEQQLKLLINDTDTKKHIEINTYHGFTWNILKSHGYLLCKFRNIKLLPPPEAAARLAEITNASEIESEKQRLFYNEGLLHFDIFAELCSELLNQSDSLCRIICDKYPIIIFDEFQDTNHSEWNLVKLLGRYSRIIALADLDQRIYDFRGADPARIHEFATHFKHTMFDLGTENNRSNGTDIAKFGNDLLLGEVGQNVYNNVSIVSYNSYITPVHLTLKTEILNAISRLNNKDKEWSLAILVPSNKLMLQVSDFMSEKQSLSRGRVLPAINHEVAVDQAALSLAAVLIAGLLEQGEPHIEITYRLLLHLNDYTRGRNNKITQNDLKLSKSIDSYLTDKTLRTNKKTLQNCFKIADKCSKIELTGIPQTDWVTMRSLLNVNEDPNMRQLAKDSMFIRLLHKGSILQSGLADLWRAQNNYKGAVNLVKNALLQEHFSMTSKVYKGVQLMTIHKSKGKEFDEVIIYEGVYSDRILRDITDEKEIHKSKLLLRVGVTRAVSKSTILTPAQDKCPLLTMGK